MVKDYISTINTIKELPIQVKLCQKGNFENSKVGNYDFSTKS